MRAPQQLEAPEAPLGELPTAIWMPTACFRSLPCCYNGTPLQMVEQMAAEMGPKLSVHDTIDLLIEFLSSQRDVNIHLPAEEPEEEELMPEYMRATFFIAILLDAGVAEPMPAA